MSAPTIKGDVKIGFAGTTITGTIRDNSSHQPTGDIEYIRNENNEEAAAIISNPGKRLNIEFTCATVIPALKIGDVVTVDGVTGLVESADIRYSRTATRGTVTVYKPDSLTLGE